MSIRPSVRPSAHPPTPLLRGAAGGRAAGGEGRWRGDAAGCPPGVAAGSPPAPGCPRGGDGKRPPARLSGLWGLLSEAGRPNLPFLFPLFGFASCWSAYLLYTSSGGKQMSSAFTWEPCSDLPPVASSRVLCTCVRCAGSWEPPADFICSFPDRLPKMKENPNKHPTHPQRGDKNRGSPGKGGHEAAPTARSHARCRGKGPSRPGGRGSQQLIPCHRAVTGEKLSQERRKNRGDKLGSATGCSQVHS